MEQRNISLEKSFQSCSFAAAKRSNESVNSEDSELSEAPNSITSFFVDSSGRSSFTVPLQMIFDKKKDLEQLLTANCFDPPPRNPVSDIDLTDDNNDKNDGDGDGDGAKTNASVAFEVKSISSDRNDTNQVTVEGVSILSCSVKNLVVTFKTKVTVRATTRGPPSDYVTNSIDSPAQMSPSRFYC